MLPPPPELRLPPVPPRRLGLPKGAPASGARARALCPRWEAAQARSHRRARFPRGTQRTQGTTRGALRSRLAPRVRPRPAGIARGAATRPARRCSGRSWRALTRRVGDSPDDVADAIEPLADRLPAEAHDARDLVLRHVVQVPIRQHFAVVGVELADELRQQVSIDRTLFAGPSRGARGG